MHEYLRWIVCGLIGFIAGISVATMLFAGRSGE